MNMDLKLLKSVHNSLNPTFYHIYKHSITHINILKIISKGYDCIVYSIDRLHKYKPRTTNTRDMSNHNTKN